MNRMDDIFQTAYQHQEIINHLREYLDVMKDEPDEYILLSKVYHNLRRILGDE